MKFTFRRYKLLLLLILFLYEVKGSSEREKLEDSLSRTFEFQNSPSGQACEYRRQQGFCQRRSNCRKPTRSTCRFGLNPVVCCLDDPLLHTTTTTSKPRTTKATAGRPIDIKAIDLTYPDCGFRAPKVASSPATSINSRNTNRRRGKRASLSLKELFNPLTSRNGMPVDRVIVGGVEANANSWPWMVAIFKEAFSGGSKRFLCGASLISKRYVLTAAHCFDAERGNIVPSKFFVVVGAHTTKDGTEYPVEDITIHASYKIKQYYNDIALLKVGKEVVLGKKVYPVCLPSENLRSKIKPEENTVTVTGWGDTSFGGVSSMVLQEVNVPIVPLMQCNESYSKIPKNSFPNGITNLFICAGLQEGGKDACQGDSGGPMTTKLIDESYVQLGVVSFGHGCAQAGFPGVYTRLSEYTKWLYENTDFGQI
ncbi:clotting factor G beta subunit-like [Uloborus diversus]|uniref:clotting factor G beta subunit-like n=1 Tax=Uloborus diversus TaxID=327109 RepID=UPI002409C38D|nr:clotting factor G beta subunit-like [Uloborus diversus]